MYLSECSEPDGQPGDQAYPKLPQELHLRHCEWYFRSSSPSVLLFIPPSSFSSTFLLVLSLILSPFSYSPPPVSFSPSSIFLFPPLSPPLFPSPPPILLPHNRIIDLRSNWLQYQSCYHQEALTAMCEVHVGNVTDIKIILGHHLKALYFDLQAREGSH